MKVLIQALALPAGAKFTKRTGTHEYTIYDEIKVFRQTPKRKKSDLSVIIPSLHCRFYSAASRIDVSEIHYATEVLWHVSAADFYKWLSKTFDMEKKHE